MEKYKIIFYNENEEILQEIERTHANLDKLFYEVINDFGCDDNVEYIEKNGHIYGYIKTFNCYGRFHIEKNNLN